MINRIIAVSGWLCSGAVLLSAANLIFLLFRHSYAFTIGPVPFIAHGLFKPLLLLNGSFLLAVLVKNPRPSAPKLSVRVSRRALAAFLLAVLILHLSLSLRVNPLDDEWNYRLLTSQWRTLGDVARLFFTGQIASWYRPLGFASLWIDRQLFAEHVWAYHLQNIFLHGLNVILAFVLSKRLGLAEPTARYAAVLFAVSSVSYEPVMWPSARFDLLAVTFIAFALIAAIDYLHGSGARALWITIGCYVLAICSKESAYSFPLLATVVLAVAFYSKRDSAESAATRRRIMALSAGILLVTGSMLALRFAIFGGLGGYASAPALRSPDLSFTAATVRSIFARGLPISLLSINLDYPLSPFLRANSGFTRKPRKQPLNSPMPASAIDPSVTLGSRPPRPHAPSLARRQKALTSLAYPELWPD